MAILKVTRDAGYADLMRAYAVMIDGKKIGELENGKSKEFPISAGDHTITARIDWCGSETLRFHAKDGDSLSFTISSSLRGIKILLAPWSILYDRNAYLSIEKNAS
ncbi:MAG: hypothetical protein ACRERV_07620 [Methylococcales bacterium]